MTNPPTDEMRAAFEAWMKTRPGFPFAGTYANLMWASWQDALSHQGEVVKATELRALSASWDERADGMEAKGLGDAFGSLGNIRTGLVSAYKSASEDLTAIISKVEKV